MSRFKFLNFTPRAQFVELATIEINRLLRQTPEDTQTDFRAFFDQDRFVLEAQMVSSEVKFKASVAVPIPRNHPRGREWQHPVLEELITDLERQITKWRETCRSGVKQAA